MKGTVLPKDYFLVRGRDGEYHWYSEDPLKAADRDSVEVSIEDVITQAVGWGDVDNPVMVHLNCAKIDRSVPFHVGLLAGIRKGSEDKHFEDMSGHVIDVLEAQNPDKEFPLTGVVLGSAGEFIEARQYSFKGLCKDGEESHRLIAIVGPARFISGNEAE